MTARPRYCLASAGSGSRVENGHTVPSIETLEKWARALAVPLYELFYDGDEPPKPLKLLKKQDDLWGSAGKDARALRKLCVHLSRMDAGDRKLIYFMVQKMTHARR